VAEAVLLQPLELAAHLRVGGDAGRAVDLPRHGLDLLPERCAVFVDELHLAGRVLDHVDDGMGEVLGALAALRPVACKDHAHAEGFHARPDHGVFGGRVVREMVDGDDTREPVVLADVAHVPLQVGEPALDGGDVLLVEGPLLDATVILERTDGGHDDRTRSGADRTCGT
jgi:hypothetical protein